MATPFNQLSSHPVDQLENPANIVKLFLVKVYDRSMTPPRSTNLQEQKLYLALTMSKIDKN